MMLFSRRRLLAGLLLSAVLLSGCAPKSAVSSGSESGSGGSSSTSAPAGDVSQTPEPQPEGSSSAPETGSDTSQVQTPEGDGSAGDSQPANAGKTVPAGGETQPVSGSASLSGYDFSQPCPESPAVDNSYFEDAAFIGDSRTDGFLLYSGIGCGENLTSNGLSIFKLAEKKALTIDGEKYTLLEALALKEYGKVYLSLGVNELGYYDDEGFYQSYLDAIDAIRAVQPNAVIYIQGLIPLNEEQIAASSGRTYLTNEHLRVYNELMFQAAQEKQVVFLDLYSVFADENGSLPAEASRDGVHLRSEYCKQWLSYLQTHTVSYDTLYPNGAPSVGSAGDQGETAEGSENP